MLSLSKQDFAGRYEAVLRRSVVCVTVRARVLERGSEQVVLLGNTLTGDQIVRLRSGMKAAARK